MRLSAGASLRVLAHPVFVAGVVLAVFLGTLVAISLAPSWKLAPLDLGTPGENLQPVSWSPDGTRITGCGSRSRS